MTVIFSTPEKTDIFDIGFRFFMLSDEIAHKLL